jgi:hypothetical protein
MTTANTFTYSNEIVVPAKTKGGGGNGGGGNNREASDTVITTASAKPIPLTNTFVKKVTVGPNPNNGSFFFSVTGIEKETVATLYTIDGRLIKQFKIVNLQQQKVSGIPAGMYLLKIPGFETQKIIVNGEGNVAPQSTRSNTSTKL